MSSAVQDKVARDAIRDAGARAALVRCAPLLVQAQAARREGDLDELGALREMGIWVSGDYVRVGLGGCRYGLMVGLWDFFCVLGGPEEVVALAGLATTGLENEEDYLGALLAGWDYPDVGNLCFTLYQRQREKDPDGYDEEEEPTFPGYLLAGRMVARLCDIDPGLQVSRAALEALVAGDSPIDLSGIDGLISETLALLRGDHGE